ncbi:MAG TPA: kynureninase [Steroidobacteraceae bacterium]|nr:kynureninase [Steroidobacteraceae bacterium]
MSTAPLTFQAQLEWARAQDAADPLGPLRANFALPRGADGRTLVYLCGHSLGLAPLGARAMLEAELSDWERLGVLGHEQARTPWVSYAEQLQGPLAALVGAAAQEIVAMNSLTVNLHLLLAHFYRPAGSRRSILIESGAFSSDRHAVATQIAWRGLDPASELIELAPAAGQTQLCIEDIEAAIGAQGERLALVLWPAVQYLTGQRFDLARIARAAHAAGATVGFDLAHAIGNVPLSLHAQQADFAVWCSYKYLNGGPGAIGGAFVHERHLHGAPQLAGWWGHEGSTRFALAAHFVPAAGALAFAQSNPPIFSSAPLRASLPLFAAAGLGTLREKSLRLTGYLEALLMQLADGQLELLTPSDPEQRGCQLSVRVAGGRERAQRLHAQLSAQGVIGDLRAPDVIRLAPVPFYNGFVDVMRGAWHLSDALKMP